MKNLAVIFAVALIILNIGMQAVATANDVENEKVRLARQVLDKFAFYKYYINEEKISAQTDESNIKNSGCAPELQASYYTERESILKSAYGKTIALRLAIDVSKQYAEKQLDDIAKFYLNTKLGKYMINEVSDRVANSSHFCCIEQGSLPKNLVESAKGFFKNKSIDLEDVIHFADFSGNKFYEYEGAFSGQGDEKLLDEFKKAQDDHILNKYFKEDDKCKVFMKYVR